MIAEDQDGEDTHDEESALRKTSLKRFSTVSAADVNANVASQADSKVVTQSESMLHKKKSNTVLAPLAREKIKTPTKEAYKIYQDYNKKVRVQAE